MENATRLFLDSGAFSAYTKGIKIDIQAYIAFIKEHGDAIEYYANLDVIGDAKATLENQRIMEAAGLSPIPCYHYGEDEKYLHFYINNYPIIALGGVARERKVIDWMDRCFDIICDQPSRLPKIRVHGFSVTNLTLVCRYPWYSVDSTSWVLTSRTGAVIVPKFRNGKYEYWNWDKNWMRQASNPYKVFTSSRSPNTKAAGQHFSTFSPMEQEIITQYLTTKGYKIGSSEFRREPKKYKLKEGERWFGPVLLDNTREVELIIEPGLGNNYTMRDEMNIIYFMDLEKSLPVDPWPFRRPNKIEGFGL